MNENILLTITMLVSDREDTIEKCMKSLVHLREAVPSELVVVDTAGNQICMDIVRQYTDQIVPFKWCDDFSAARNAGVEKARGEWIMYIDDDEWFESTEELENFFLSGTYRKYNSAAYIVKNYADPAGIRWNDVDVVRLTKRVKETRFIRKIHEQFYPLTRPFCYLKDYVHHYGYVFSSGQEKSKHSQRNIRLLLEQHKESPEDLQPTAQLIQEYQVAREYFSAIELCKGLWPVRSAWQTAAQARFATYAAIAELKMYILQKRYTDGYDAGNKMLEFLSQRDNSILARGVLFNLMTEFCYQLKKYDEALEYIDRFHACKKEWDQYPDPKSLDPFSNCALFMSDKYAGQLSLLKMHLYVLQEEWAEAKATLLSIDRQEDGLTFLTDTPADVVALLKREAYQPSYASALKALYAKEEMRPLLYAAIDKLEPAEKDIILEYLRQISPEDVRMCVYHLIYAGNQGDLDAAVPALEKMRGEGYPLFLEEEEYWNSLQKLNVNINEYMPELSMYSWMELAKKIWTLVPLKVCETAYVCLTCGLEKADLRYIYLSALTVEKRLFSEEEQEALTSLTPDEIWDRLNLLSQYWVSCAASLYREDVFMGDLISAIPPCYQFGWYIMQANAVKNVNLNLFLHKVADAAKAYPAMKELCKKVIEGCKELL